MTKQEFLDTLSEGLKNFPSNERNEILYDYEEHFRIGETSGKSDQKIISELGDPYMILSQYKSSYDNNNFESSKSDYKNNNGSSDNNYYYDKNSYYTDSHKRRSSSTAMNIILAILIIIAAIPVGSVLLSLLLALYSTALGFTVSGIGMMIGGVTGGLALSIISIPFSIPLSALVFIGIGTIALGLLIFLFSIWLTRLIFDLFKKIFYWLKQELVY